MRSTQPPAAITVRASRSGDSKTRAPNVAARLEETTRGIAFGESLTRP